MKKILVSACLLGDKCRYDGESVPDENIQKVLDEADIVPFCPEVEGGLTTPRSPSEIKKGNVYNEEGKNVTSFYEAGARKCLELCKLLGIEIAILKEKSPSCATHFIHSGYFDGRIVKGEGWTTALLKKNGIQVFSEEEIDQVLSLLHQEEDDRQKQKEESRLRREARLAEKESSEEAKRLEEEKKKLEQEIEKKEEHRSFRKSSYGPRKEGEHSSFKRREYGLRKNYGDRRSSFRPRYKKDDADTPKENGESSPVEGSHTEEKRSFRPRRPSYRKEGSFNKDRGGSNFHKGNRSFHKDGFRKNNFHKSERSFSKGRNYKKEDSIAPKEGDKGE